MESHQNLEVINLQKGFSDTSESLSQHQSQRENLQNLQPENFNFIDKPLQTQDSNQSEGSSSQQMESIYMRIQNLRKNLQNQQPVQNQFSIYRDSNENFTHGHSLPNYEIQNQSNPSQSQYNKNQSQQMQFRNTTTFGNQTDSHIQENFQGFNSGRLPVKIQSQTSGALGVSSYILQESQRSNLNLGHSQFSLESYDNRIPTQNNLNQNHRVRQEFLSPNPLTHLVESETQDKYNEIKSNLSPKLLSTQGEVHFQQSEIDLLQSEKRFQNAQQQNSIHSTKFINQYGNNSQQQPSIYTFNHQSSINTLNQQEQSNIPQNLISIQDIIKESEERVKRETEFKFQNKIKDLEQRSVYLDRSLELIEDMKTKFNSLESQSKDYNQLLMRYNDLLRQFNSQSQRNSPGQSKLSDKNQLKRFNTLQGLNPFSQDSSSLNLLSHNQSMVGGEFKPPPLQELRDYSNQLRKIDQSFHKQTTIEKENQALKQQVEQLQIEIERIKLDQSANSRRKKSLSKQSSPKHRSSSLRNLGSRVSGILAKVQSKSKVMTSREVTTRPSSRSRSKDKQQFIVAHQSNQTSRKFLKKQGQLIHRSQENIQLLSNRHKSRESNLREANPQLVKLQNQATKNLATNGYSLEFFQRQTFVDLHRKIDKLEMEKNNLLKRLKAAEQREQEDQRINAEGLMNGEIPLKCCCSQIKLIYEEKQRALENIAEHWKAKTSQLVGKYYKSLQVLREDHQKLRQVAVQAVDQLRQFSENSIGEVLQRQTEFQSYYEKKVKGLRKENKSLSKRIIEKRNKVR